MKTGSDLAKESITGESFSLTSSSSDSYYEGSSSSDYHSQLQKDGSDLGIDSISDGC
jgi:hypothetical protein